MIFPGSSGESSTCVAKTVTRCPSTSTLASVMYVGAGRPMTCTGGAQRWPASVVHWIRMLLTLCEYTQ